MSDSAVDNQQSKLRRLLDTQGLMTGAEWKANRVHVEKKRVAGDFDVDSVLPGEVIHDDDASFYLVRQTFPLDTVHGECTLGDALDADAAHIALSANDEELAGFNPRTAVFIDTETTGLMGGSGTVAFLIGVGYFTEDAFCLDQCFMRDYDDEEPMLNFLAKRFAQSECLVSYNGKSFDLPLLRTRYITNRIPYRLDGMPHYDLVHASRRFWRKRLRDCSLGNIEREILGIQRDGDVDSALIPQLWLDYLHTRDARKLKQVFYHHEVDILSLVSLTATLSRRLAQPEASGFDHDEDRVSLVRVHFQQRRYAEVLALSESLMKSLRDPQLRQECFELRGYSAKRSQAWEIMETAWRDLITEFPRHLQGRVELAIHCEHRKRDLVEARALCRGGLELLETRRTLSPHLGGVGYDQNFRRRLTRIERKLSRTSNDNNA